MQQIPGVASQAIATALQTLMDNAKLRLFVSGYVIGPNDTLGLLEGVEATFSGYPAGGYATGTWTTPILLTNGGSITASQQVVATWVAPGSGAGTANNVAGWFVVDAAGNLIADGTFNSVEAMSAAGDGFLITIAMLSGNPSQVQCWIDGSLQP